MTATFAHFRTTRLAVAALVLALLGACVHKIDIQQGNFLDKEDIDRISVGMTRVQVRALLGTPMVADPFHLAHRAMLAAGRSGRNRNALD